MATMLDIAHRRWPEVEDRKELLVRLAAAGRDAIAPEVDVIGRDERRQRQLAALSRSAELVDADALLDDAAWR